MHKLNTIKMYNNIGRKNMATEKKFSALIVDDDSVARSIGKKFLDKNGFEIKMAENGQEAVDFFRAGYHFDLVIMDMEMPIKDGIQATKELRALGVRSLIIGMSACNSDANMQAFLKAGLDEFFAKPMSMAKVAAIVGRLTK